MTIEVFLRFMMCYTLSLSAVPKDFGGLRVGKSHRKGKSAVKLDLIKEELDGIGGGHSQ